MPLNFNDTGSGVIYGLDQITLNGVQFYANDMGGSAPTEVKNLLDEVGSARKAVGVRAKKTGTYTIQLDSLGAKASASAAISMSIAAADAPSGSSFVAWVTNKDISKSNESFATMTIGWEEKLN